jgi:hypothetical protein
MMTRSQFAARLQALEAAVLPRPQVPVPTAVEIMQRAGLEPDLWQLQVLKSQSSRILLNCCRQSGKSCVVSVAALAHSMAVPQALTLILSPSERQSSETFRQLLTFYRPWATTLPPEAQTQLKLELRNGSRILALPGSSDSTIRGFSRVGLLIIDEASRVSDSLYGSARLMMAVSTGRLIALSTPFGKRGWWYTAWSEGLGWQRVMVTAEQCSRISASFLAEERASLPPLLYESEYCCRFVDVIDQVFLTEQVQAALSSDIVPLF